MSMWDVIIIAVVCLAIFRGYFKACVAVSAIGSGWSSRLWRRRSASVTSMGLSAVR